MLTYHQRLVTVGLCDDAILREVDPTSTAKKLAVLILM
jgi:hypothetical protein